jgi:hypothetical protein
VVKPESIAKMKNGIQIVDTHEWLEARLSIAFAAYRPKLNRTLLVIPKN